MFAGALAALRGDRLPKGEAERVRLAGFFGGAGLIALLLYREVSGSLLTVAWGAESVILLAAGFPIRERILRLCGIGLLGAGLSIFVASIYASAIESVSAESSAPAAMGVITFCLYGSQMLFPLISGPVGQWAGPAAVFLLLAILVLLGLVLTVTMKRSRAVHKAASPEPNCEATS